MKGILILSFKVGLSAVVQGLFRMREINNGHYVDIMIDHLMEKIVVGKNVNIQLYNLLIHLYYTDIKYINHDITSLAIQQNLSYITKYCDLNRFRMAQFDMAQYYTKGAMTCDENIILKNYFGELYDHNKIIVPYSIKKQIMPIIVHLYNLLSQSNLKHSFGALKDTQIQKDTIKLYEIDINRHKLDCDKLLGYIDTLTDQYEKIYVAYYIFEFDQRRNGFPKGIYKDLDYHNPFKKISAYLSFDFPIYISFYSYIYGNYPLGYVRKENRYIENLGNLDNIHENFHYIVLNDGDKNMYLIIDNIEMNFIMEYVRNVEIPRKFYIRDTAGNVYYNNGCPYNHSMDLFVRLCLGYQCNYFEYIYLIDDIFNGNLSITFKQCVDILQMFVCIHKKITYNKTLFTYLMDKINSVRSDDRRIIYHAYLSEATYVYNKLRILFPSLSITQHKIYNIVINNIKLFLDKNPAINFARGGFNKIYELNKKNILN